MTELEKLQRAKMYMERLAEGFDPVSGRALPESGSLSGVRLSRCFAYVSEVLGRVIENGGAGAPARPEKRPKRTEFSLSAQERERFPFSTQPLTVSELTAKLGELIDQESMRRIPTTAITDWLLDCGFLELRVDSEGKRSRVPTPAGEGIGLSSELRSSPRGDYFAVFYSVDAQRFVLDNLDAIMEARQSRRAEKKLAKEAQPGGRTPETQM